MLLVVCVDALRTFQHFYSHVYDLLSFWVDPELSRGSSVVLKAPVSLEPSTLDLELSTLPPWHGATVLSVKVGTWSYDSQPPLQSMQVPATHCG